MDAEAVAVLVKLISKIRFSLKKLDLNLKKRLLQPLSPFLVPQRGFLENTH